MRAFVVLSVLNCSLLFNMTNRERKSMIEQWVTEINPKAILRTADARCGARYAVQLFLLQESLSQDAQTTCHWSSWNSTF